jgi:hypothetical protein
MVFERQWFRPGSQIGLHDYALLTESLLNNGQLTLARKTLDLLYEVAGDAKYCERIEHRIRHLEKRKASGDSTLRLIFDGFWPDHDPNQCQLVDFIESATTLKVVVNTCPDEADIIVSSCYGKNPSLNSCLAPMRLLFLGENVRPIYNDFDISLSSDVSSYRSRNIYFPLWLFEIDWFSRSYPDRKPYPKALLTSKRSVDLSSRPKRGSVFVGNNAEPNRISLIYELRSHGIEVATFGSQSKPVADKIALYKEYSLVICPENSYYPGYITEKPFHAWLSGTPYLYLSVDIGSPLQKNPLCINMAFDWEVRDTSFISTINNVISHTGQISVPPLFSEQELTLLLANTLAKIRRALAQFR